MGTLCETFLAVFASAGFLFCVNHNMPFQMTVCTKILPTDVALVCSFLQVPFVYTTLKHKFFVTITALTQFLFDVNCHVVLQMCTSCL